MDLLRMGRVYDGRLLQHCITSRSAGVEGKKQKTPLDRARQVLALGVINYTGKVSVTGQSQACFCVHGTRRPGTQVGAIVFKFLY